MRHNKRIDRLVKMAMLTAISLVLVFVVKFPIFAQAPFLEFDFADVPILIGTFMFGPISGLCITAVVSVLQWLVASPASGYIGALMHFLATGSMVLVAGLIYKKQHTLKGAILSLIFGALTMVVVTIPLNLTVSPVFLVLSYNMPYSVAQAEIINIIWVFIAFNAIKAFGNSLITFLLYKSVSRVLKIELI